MEDQNDDLAVTSMRHDWNLRAQLNPFQAIDAGTQHDGFESFYDRGNEIVTTQFAPIFISRSTQQPVDRLLDLGCGMGRLFPGLSNWAREIVGVDVSQVMLERGKDHCPAPAKWEQGTGYSLENFADASFNLVISFEMLQHLPNKKLIESYLEEVFRVLEPGGLFVLQLRRSSDTFRQAIFRILPRRIRSWLSIRMQSVGVLPVAGDVESWIGVSMRPGLAKAIVEKLGARDVEIREDEFHQNHLGYWLIGSK
jgi:ubiquinone/menaquinone biosynthesis C-methylase UbiE